MPDPTGERAEYCKLCGCDSFECGGGVTGVCIRQVAPDTGPYCARLDASGAACGETIPCASHALEAAIDAAGIALSQESTAANRSRIGRALKLMSAALKASKP